ncbi:MAG TPA: methionine adenosyltransferase domain-containing protein [Patescibacteria group bacterium]|nr:methionine adenosyltransferase domain-containing protein [Patescibacteria group bacterium]
MFKAVESVMAGQPDKTCDRIADAIVDEYLRRDPDSRVDLKVMGCHGMIMIGGEVRSTVDLDLSVLAKRAYVALGYTDEAEVFVNVEQPSEERQSVHGAADLIVVNGYATRETREFLPLPLVYAHAFARRLDDVRHADPTFHWMGPDGKVQVVMEGKKMTDVTVLVQHAGDISPQDAQARILERIVEPVTGTDGVKILVNPAGSFIVGGFQAVAGASGNKCHVDFYGGLIPHGDHTLSGKDPSKAERSGAYMARFVAKQLVAQGLADTVLITAAYTLGRPDPLMLTARGTGPKSRGVFMDFTNLVKQQYDFRPEAVVERLNLKRPLYEATAAYGHFGREGFPWEEN